MNAASLLMLLPLCAPAAQDETVESVTKELVARGDDADVQMIGRLADFGTRDALAGLFDVYEAMYSVYMRRAVLRGIAQFDADPELALDALQYVTDVATLEDQRAMRSIAVDVLKGCSNRGKDFLLMIVESNAEDEIRERAFEAHIGDPRPEDFAWYEQLYERKFDPNEKLGKAELEEVAKKGYPLRRVRELAFDTIVSQLSLEEVMAATSDKNDHIRATALEELDSRGDSKALDLAEEFFEDPKAKPVDRLIAARVIARKEGPKVADDFIKDATKNDAPEDFALGLAEIVADMRDDKVDKSILKQVGKGRGLRLLFSLRAAKNIRDPKLDKILMKVMTGKDERAAREAMRMLGERKSTDALEDLEDMLEDSESARRTAIILETMGAIHGMDEAWIERLSGYVDHPNIDIRNGAIEALASTGDERWLPILLKAVEHEVWSTRLAAAQGLEKLRVKEGVGALVGRMEEERGRMLIEISEILFRLTGRPFGTSAGMWGQWWKAEQDRFEFVTAAELRKLEAEQERNRLKQVTTSEFFGIKIESERVIFIIDVSGSMNEPTRGATPGERGEPRIDLAKRELLKAIDALDERSFFNIVPFSGGVFSWADEITQITPDAKADAEEFVGRLGANGGTNLFGALRLALEDTDADTVYVLSDGEPSVGEVIDPGAIRRIIAEWNEKRGVVFNCIAVGGALDVLEWIAADSGGTYVRHP